MFSYFVVLSWPRKVWFCKPVYHIVIVTCLTCLTCPGKKISILSNKPRRNTLPVLMLSPLTTLHVSPAMSEVTKLIIIIQPGLSWVLEVLCHPVWAYSGLYWILLWPRETDLFSGRPKYQQFPQLLWRFHLHRWRWAVNQPGPLWLVEECRGSALIGRELHGVAPPALLCHKEQARASKARY